MVKDGFRLLMSRQKKYKKATHPLHAISGRIADIHYHIQLPVAFSKPFTIKRHDR